MAMVGELVKRPSSLAPWSWSVKQPSTSRRQPCPIRRLPSVVEEVVRQLRRLAPSVALWKDPCSSRVRGHNHKDAWFCKDQWGGEELRPLQDGDDGTGDPQSATSGKQAASNWQPAVIMPASIGTLWPVWCKWVLCRLSRGKLGQLQHQTARRVPRRVLSVVTSHANACTPLVAYTADAETPYSDLSRLLLVYAKHTEAEHLRQYPPERFPPSCQVNATRNDDGLETLSNKCVCKRG